MVGVLAAPERVKMAEGVRGRIARWRSGVTATKTERTLAFQAEEARVRESRVAESIVDDCWSVACRALLRRRGR